MVDLDANPSILIPHYDVDTSVVFLTGRGDSLVLAFHVVLEAPYLVPLSHASVGAASGTPLHQCLGFLPKRNCDVASVEVSDVAKWRHNVKIVSQSVSLKSIRKLRSSY